MNTFDAIVIGTGQAGPALAARLAEAGQSVAVIERDKFGGTCVNDGGLGAVLLKAPDSVGSRMKRMNRSIR